MMRSRPPALPALPGLPAACSLPPEIVAQICLFLVQSAEIIAFVKACSGEGGAVPWKTIADYMKAAMDVATWQRVTTEEAFEAQVVDREFTIVRRGLVPDDAHLDWVGDVTGYGCLLPTHLDPEPRMIMGTEYGLLYNNIMRPRNDWVVAGLLMMERGAAYYDDGPTFSRLPSLTVPGLAVRKRFFVVTRVCRGESTRVKLHLVDETGARIVSAETGVAYGAVTGVAAAKVCTKLTGKAAYDIKGIGRYKGLVLGVASGDALRRFVPNMNMSLLSKGIARHRSTPPV